MEEFYQPQKKQETLEEQGVDIPFELLQPETLDQVIREFVMREGTDYGFQEASFETKITQVRRQLEAGDIKIVFDVTSETGTIVRRF